MPKVLLCIGNKSLQGSNCMSGQTIYLTEKKEGDFVSPFYICQENQGDGNLLVSIESGAGVLMGYDYLGKDSSGFYILSDSQKALTDILQLKISSDGKVIEYKLHKGMSNPLPLNFWN